MKKAIVVIGGGLVKVGENWKTIDFKEGGDDFAPSNDRWRVEAGAVLWHKNPEYVIIASGGRGQLSKIPGVPTLAEVIKKELEELGVSGEIIKEEKSGNTLEQLQELGDLISTKDLKEVIILSNEWQIPRIKAIFELYPGLKEVFKNVSVKFVSAEDVLIEADRETWQVKVEEARGNLEMKKRFDLEKHGVEQIKNGTYKFKTYRDDKKS